MTKKPKPAEVVTEFALERSLDQELELLALNVAKQANRPGTLLHDQIDALKALAPYCAKKQDQGKGNTKPDAGDFRSRLGGLIDGASRIHPDRGE